MQANFKINLAAIIPESYAKLRLDQALAKLFPEYSRARIQQWIKNQEVTVDGKPFRSKDKISGGEKVIIQATLEPQEEWSAQNIKLDILYEDDDILVLNKSIGMVVHPAVGNREGTLLNALLYYHPPLATLPRAGIIHRIDKDTSGILIIAKTLPAHTHLVKQLRKRTIKREYLAIVSGVIIAGGTIKASIGRHPFHRTRMAVVEGGKVSVSHYRVLERFRVTTLIKVMLETGRTHQIRVHFAHIHHPLVGDMTYGGRLHIPAGASDELAFALRHFKHQALHAHQLEIQHPTTNKIMTWTAPQPDDMQKLLELLRKDMKNNSP